LFIPGANLEFFGAVAGAVGDGGDVHGGDFVGNSSTMRLREHDDDPPTYSMVFFLLLHLCSLLSTALLVEVTVGA
jgi:hypothetical protein